MPLQGNHYRAHDSTPSTEYIRDMQSRVGGSAPLAKGIGGNEAVDKLLAKFREVVGGENDTLSKAVDSQDPFKIVLAVVEGIAAEVSAMESETGQFRKGIAEMQETIDHQIKAEGARTLRMLANRGEPG